jgi:hypothetical protein
MAFNWSTLYQAELRILFLFEYYIQSYSLRTCRTTREDQLNLRQLQAKSKRDISSLVEK